MKFIEQVYLGENVGVIVTVIICIIIALIGLIGVVYFTNDTKKEHGDLIINCFGTPAVLAVVVGVLVPILTVQITSWERSENIATQFETTYNLGLTDDQVAELDYPGYKPERDFEVFGKTTVNVRTSDGFVRKTVYLVWEDNHMVLAESDNGKQFNVIQKEK